MRFSDGVPEQLKLAVAKNHAAIAPNEALLIFVCLPCPLDELSIALSAGITVLFRDYCVPLLQTAQFFSAVTQHFVQCTIGEMFVGIDLVNADTDLRSFENRTKELLALPQFPVGLFFLGNIFS